MLNPREIYIRACSIAGKEPLADYFAPVLPSYEDPLLFLGSGEKPQVQNLAKFLKTGTGSDALSSAFAIFMDYNSRITLEGLLSYQGVESARKIRKIRPAVINAYCANFFKVEHLLDPAWEETKSEGNKDIFFSLIRDESAQLWFKVCSRKTFAELDFMLNGTYAINADAVEDLQKIRAKATQNYLLYGDYPDDSLVNGLSPKDRVRIILAQKEAAIAVKAIQAETQSANMMEELKAFLKEMKLDVVEESVDQYKKDDGKATQADLEAQYDKISPIASEASSLPDDDYEKD